MEKIIFPMTNVRITQGVNGLFSHKGSYALDCAGKDGGIDNVYAPFTCIVKRIYANDNAVWIESVDKVRFANGIEDYCTILLAHDDDISDLYVGKRINQGEVFYQEGRKGKVTGNHIHLEVARGKYKGWFKNLYGVWMLMSAIHPASAFFMYKVNVINDCGYDFKETDKAYVEIRTLYTVKKGDTLSKIAKQYRTTIEKIAKDNGIKNPNLIKIGQILVIK